MNTSLLQTLPHRSRYSNFSKSSALRGHAPFVGLLKGVPLVLALLLVVVLPVAALPGPTDSTLSGLSLSSGSLNPAFSPAVTTYSASVPNATASLTVTPTVATVGATVTVNGSSVIPGAASQSIALQLGINAIAVVVTSPDLSGTTTYTVSVTRLPLSSDATLSALSLSVGTLNPVFSPFTVSYQATVPNVSSSIRFTPTATDGGATITINGVVIGSGTASLPVALEVGMNSITLQVAAANGVAKKYYQINITRSPSAIATLADLSISDGWLTPGFSPNVTQYSAMVPNSVSWLNIFALPANDGAKVAINGILVGSVGYSADLVVGKNTITVAVTAQDGAAAKAYTIFVTRAKASDGKLSGLTVKSVALTPKFKSKTLSYKATASKSKTTVQVKPVSVHKYDTINVNGKYVKSGVWSAPVKLKPGKNLIKVVVAADGGKTITYKITIIRPKTAPSAKALPEPALAKRAAPNAKSTRLMVDGKSYLQLTVRRADGQPKPVVEVSSNLVDWFSGDKHTTTLIDDGRILRVRDNTAAGTGSRRFIRVR